MVNSTYPNFMKDITLEMYLQGHSPHQIEVLTGIPSSTVRYWGGEENILRSRSEAQQRRRHPEYGTVPVKIDDMEQGHILKRNKESLLKEFSTLCGVPIASYLPKLSPPLKSVCFEMTDGNTIKMITICLLCLIAGSWG